jgi:hypothetical protein
LPITKTAFLLVAGFDGKNEPVEIAFKTTPSDNKKLFQTFSSP